WNRGNWNRGNWNRGNTVVVRDRGNWNRGNVVVRNHGYYGGRGYVRPYYHNVVRPDLRLAADHPRALLQLLPPACADHRELQLDGRLLLGPRPLELERLRVDLAARPLRARRELRRPGLRLRQLLTAGAP